MPLTDLIFDPERLLVVPVYQLLEAATQGYLGVDHRFLHAILDQPERSIPDLVRFAAEDHDQDPVLLDDQLLEIFRVLGTPEGIPFYMKVLRKDPADIDDDLVEAIVQLGAASVDPLLELLKQFDDEDAGDVPFVLSVLHVRDDRILEALTNRLDYDPGDAAVCLEIYGDRKAIPALEAVLAEIPSSDPTHNQIKSLILRLASNVETRPEFAEPFDIWELYPETDSPPLDVVSEADRLAMLEVGSGELRADVVASFRNTQFSNEALVRLLGLTTSDPDPKDRCDSLSTFGDI